MKPKIYITKGAMYSFTVVERDAEGKVVTKFDPRTRENLTVEKMYKFSTVQGKPSQDTYCHFVVNDSTPAHVAAALEEMAKDPACPVLTEKDWIKRTNPERSKAEARADDLEAQLAEARRLLADKDAEVKQKNNALADMEAQLEQVTSPGKRKG